MTDTRTRELLIERAAESDAFPVTLSTETPVLRHFGYEVLSHAPEDVDLTRAPLPVIEGHDTSRLNIGIVEDLRLAGGKLRGLLRLGKSARAAEVAADIRAGIVRNVSIGYQVGTATRIGDKDGHPVFRFPFAPHELSLVAAPADPQSGIFRSQSMQTMKTDDRAQVRDDELSRVRGIRKLGESFGLEGPAQAAIDKGTPIEEFRSVVIGHLDAVKAAPMPYEPEAPRAPAFIRSRHDRGPQHGYSYTDAIGVLAGDRSVDHGRVNEWHQEHVRQTGRRAATGIFVPIDLSPRRDLDLAATTALKPTQHIASDYVDVLRPTSIVMLLNPTRITGLTGAASIPRKTASATAGWVSLDGVSTISESAPAHDAITLGMKTVAGYVEITHAARKSSSPDLEQIVRGDLAEVLGTALDTAALQGTGLSGQPTGIAATSGINTDTFTLATPTWAKLVNLQALISDDNVDTSALAYITTPTVAHSLMSTAKAANTAEFIWEHAPDGSGRIAGRRAFYTKNSPASKIIAGNFRDLIVADWGALELAVDAGGANFQKASIAVRAILDVDIAVRHPESFAVSTGS